MAKKSVVGGESSKDVTLVKFEGGVREYSKEVHGEDHAALAKEFASKDARREVL